ncbi:hypothetical protein EVAR_28336_1 [Eumeta japonica]|uniref:Pupal cuticle protein C1B n=1 Tax=Eumeta variegata TaxID=151549 RepID=A0A4C1VA28_EUMVA|nr:hypothetical protein EVAR_28336_1 [Eumeta japonica]
MESQEGSGSEPRTKLGLELRTRQDPKDSRTVVEIENRPDVEFFLLTCVLAMAAAKPGVGVVAPVAYTAPVAAAYTAPVAAAYTAPVAYSAYSAPLAYSAYTYASPYAGYYLR